MTSKPAWSNAFGCSTTPVFLFSATQKPASRDTDRLVVEHDGPCMWRNAETTLLFSFPQATTHKPWVAASF